MDLFTIKINEKPLTFRKLSAIGILKRVGLPLNEANMLSIQDMTKLMFSVLEATCTTPAALENLPLKELIGLTADQTFVEYFQSLIGEMDQKN